MAPEPQRAREAHHLDAKLVPVEGALLARARALEAEAAVTKADGYYDDRVEYAHGHEDGLLEAKAVLAAEFRLLAEELHYWQ